MAEFIDGFKRTHTCGELRAEHTGQTARLVGWVQDYRNLGGFLFIVIRDRFGVTQVKVDPTTDPALFERAERVRGEWAIGVEGLVVDRGANANRDLPTGEIEVEAREMRVFNKSETPPFVIRDGIDAQENLRLKYRYLDLRRPELQRNIVLRSRITSIVRSALEEQGFLDLETPVLTKSTPEGARDYLVPSRIHPGQFYALPQSPQLFKQLYMVAGFDRYYQIVRCFRDEDLRADRQPEFTQIDLEASFADQETIQALCEHMVSRVFREVCGIELERPFARITYDEALARYGVDAPDLRYELFLHEVTEVVRGSSFAVFTGAIEAGGIVKAMVVPGGDAFSRKDIAALEEVAKTYGARGLAWARVVAGGALDGGSAKHLQDVAAALREALGAGEGDLLLMVAAKATVANPALGNVRKRIAEKLGLTGQEAGKPCDKAATPEQSDRRREQPDGVAGESQSSMNKKVALAWVTDFPMFEWGEAEGRWFAMHHPFTSPRASDLGLFATNPGAIRAQAYDLVLNGVELGGGSVRIHDPEVQSTVFRALDIGVDEAQEKFGFLLDALKFGAPPHAGVAFGLDRFVMLLTGAASLRDVIAYPKTNRAADLMTDAPNHVSAQQLAELHLGVVAEPSTAEAVSPAGPEA